MGGPTIEPGGHGGTPLFILSFRQRDELAAMAERAGWRAVAARRGDAVEQRFIASGAGIALIDARGAFDEAMPPISALADPVAANAGALFVLLSRGDVAHLADVYEAGATHYLASPFGEAELVQALRFAARHADRLAGGGEARASLANDGALEWRWRPGERSLALSAALASLLQTEALATAQALRRVGPAYAAGAREAIARIESGAGVAVFAHDAPGGGRIVHHLRNLDEGGIAGRIELIGSETAGRALGRDPLTGLTDGRGARLWLARRLEAGGPPIALLLIAVTQLEGVNATYGRLTGDALLRAVARRVAAVAAGAGAAAALVARLAGSEFLVAATIGQEEARLLAEAIGVAIARPLAGGDELIALGTHIGVVESAPGDDVARLLRRASTALAEGKAEGRPLRLLGQAEERAAKQRGRLAMEVRTGIARDEIRLRWQPQVRVVDGAIVGVEALVRWRHPRLGELGAEMLVAAAERAGHLEALSDAIHAKAAAEVAAWPNALKALRIAINITAADMMRDGFAPALIATLDAAGVERGRVTVELTESGLVADLGRAAGLLAELRAGGLRTAIDDFGTGYSSLAYLKALPLDYLKLDKRLSQDIDGSSRDRVVVRGVIEMARSLGLAVIAEGVETEAQLALLAQEGCNLYQGFLCAPPLETDALERLVGERSRP